MFVFRPGEPGTTGAGGYSRPRRLHGPWRRSTSMVPLETDFVGQCRETDFRGRILEQRLFGFLREVFLVRIVCGSMMSILSVDCQHFQDGNHPDAGAKSPKTPDTHRTKKSQIPNGRSRGKNEASLERVIQTRERKVPKSQTLIVRKSPKGTKVWKTRITTPPGSNARPWPCVVPWWSCNSRLSYLPGVIKSISGFLIFPRCLFESLKLKKKFLFCCQKNSKKLKDMCPIFDHPLIY